MNKLFTFNANQLAQELASVRPQQQSDIARNRVKTQNIGNKFRCKRVKRYEQIIEEASKKNKFNKIGSGKQSNCNLKSYITENLQQLSLISETNSIKKLIKIQGTTQLRPTRTKRSKTQMLLNHQKQFTFYPKEIQKNQHLQQETAQESKASINQSKTSLRKRSISYKQVPIINFPISDRKLPKVFKVKTETAQRSNSIRKISQSIIANQKNDSSKLKMLSNMGFGIKIKTISPINMQNKRSCLVFNSYKINICSLNQEDDYSCKKKGKF